MNKPRLKKDGLMWVCSLGLHRAFGHTPKYAYENLRKTIRGDEITRQMLLNKQNTQNEFERACRRIFEDFRKPML